MRRAALAAWRRSGGPPKIRHTASGARKKADLGCDRARLRPLLRRRISTRSAASTAQGGEHLLERQAATNIDSLGGERLK
jgi:hypothetical protein